MYLQYVREATKQNDIIRTPPHVLNVTLKCQHNSGDCYTYNTYISIQYNCLTCTTTYMGFPKNIFVLENKQIYAHLMV